MARSVHVTELPARISRDPRRWAGRKRREVDAVIRALKAANVGSGFVPGHRAIIDALTAMEELRGRMRVKAWRVVREKGERSA